MACAVGLDNMMGKETTGHLLFLLLDGDNSGAVPSEQALENLYAGFDLNCPEEIAQVNEEVKKQP